MPGTWQGLGAILEGGRKLKTAYQLPFLGNFNEKQHCSMYLNERDVEKFKWAIDRDFELFFEIDGLPLTARLGTVEGEHHYLHHFQFELYNNGDKIIDAKVTPYKKMGEELATNKDTGIMRLTMTYSLKFILTDEKFETRMEKYNRVHFFTEEIEIQWFSIINSIVLVLLLTGFLVFIIMRILKKDYQRYSIEDDEEQEETGWKLLHGEVFRFPPHKNLLAAGLGTGAQLLSLCFGMLFLAIIGVFYPYSRGSMYTALIVIYALISGIAGYVSGNMYKQFGGKEWIKNVLLTLSLFSVPVFLVWSVLNIIALFHSSSAALPFGTIVAILGIYTTLTFPLTLLGSIAGKNFGGQFNAPCRPKNAVRVIPPAPWYRGPLAQFFVAGFLPFSAIYVELYYVFISLWGSQLYTPYDILLIVFIILLVVTACITVALTYLQLSMEDHKWWWRSLICGGATAFFIYAYCFYFLYSESEMEGFLQVSFYFGYMFVICYAFFLMLGTVGFFSSLSFVRRIYRAIRVD